MRFKKYFGLSILIVFAIASVIIDIVLKSGCNTFNEINRILFSLVTVIAGFWVTCYLLFLQIYKDRYPLKFLQHKYLPMMKYNITYVIYCIIFGCLIIIKNGGIVENIWYCKREVLSSKKWQLISGIFGQLSTSILYHPADCSAGCI